MSPSPLTYLLTDVVGSTALWEHAPDAMRQAMARHDELVEGAVQGRGGRVVRPRGEGDSRFAVFSHPVDALAAAGALVQALAAEHWSTPGPLRVRVAVHTGESDDLYGPTVNRAARLRAAAHPGQVLVAAAAIADAAALLPAGFAVRDLGEHRLADLTDPEHVYQLVVPGVTADFPPLASLDRFRHNLPRQRDDFVGRELERAHLSKALEGSRLVTVTGPGGTGKTRLALQVAAELTDAFPDGLWFVELAGVGNNELIASALASALGVPLGLGRPPTEAVEDFLRAKTALLVLDNCEHLHGACGELVTRLLGAARELRVLATSRRPLGARGEQLFPLGPLDHPSSTHLPPTSELLHYDAIALFVARARAAHPTFVLDEENAAVVGEICARLDGIPLALELAAARLRTMPLDEIGGRLADRFALLADVAAADGSHHHSLRAALDWSWELLAPADRLALRRAGVFVSSFDLETAEAVVADGELGAADVLDALVDLVDASLVVPSFDASTRYRLLETVRTYAEEKLVDAGEQGAVRDRQLSWFADVFDRGQHTARQPTPPDLSARFGLELDDLRSALAWGLRAKRVDGLRLAGCLSFLWWARGHMTEAFTTLDSYLEAFPDAPARVRGNAHAGLRFLHAVASTGEAPKHAEIVLRLAAEEGIDEWWVSFTMGGMATKSPDIGLRGYQLATAGGYRHSASYACQQLGKAALDRGDPEEAARWFEEGVDLLRDDRRSPGLARLLSSLAAITLRLGRREEAERISEEIVQLGEDLSDPIAEAAGRAALGQHALARGDFDAAAAHFTRNVEIGRDVGMVTTMTNALISLSDLHVSRGDVQLARRYAAEAVDEARARSHGFLACLLGDLAHKALLDGDPVAAASAAREALDVSRARGDTEHEARALVVQALLEVAEGEDNRAPSLLAEALSMLARPDVSKDHLHLALEAAGMVVAGRGDGCSAVRLLAASDAARWNRKPPWEPAGLARLLDELRSELGDERLEASWEEGRAWAPRTAIDAALNAVNAVNAATAATL